MAVVETLQTDGEFYIAGSHNILDLEVLKCGRKVQLLYDFCILCTQNMAISRLNEPPRFETEIIPAHNCKIGASRNF